MNKTLKNTIMTRVVSTSFVVLALAVFKPFGLDALHWMAYVHLFVIWTMGIGVCMLTDAILTYVFKKPVAFNQGVDYIIRRNLWFQCVNTPLIALMVCLYRHFLLNDQVVGNQLSWSNYLETLAIIAFCSFAIGLYWRFKFRSRYLAAELVETKLLNERLQRIQKEEAPKPVVETQQVEAKPASIIVLTGTTSDSITLELPHLLYIEAVGNYVKIYQVQDGQVRSDMLRATSKQMEDDLQAYPMIVRCHRAFLVNLGQVEQIVAHSGVMHLHIKHCQESIPVSRSHMAGVKAAIKGAET
ncbi:MAG: LytTR family transcriptional regulator [Bacteroidaceae bacterium]|nr:LytTR family transcriptional regulator [Bacteroidaceae bacterium]